MANLFKAIHAAIELYKAIAEPADAEARAKWTHEHADQMQQFHQAVDDYGEQLWGVPPSSHSPTWPPRTRIWERDK